MTEHASELPNQSNCGNQATGYLGKAAEACAAGDTLLGMHLYLAAYEQAAANPDAPTSIEVAALREAWHLSCELKERSMAEYVFEKLEPYLTGEEIAECAMKLQELALDRLEQYGFSREDLQDMAEAITQDFLGDDGHVMKVERISIPNIPNMGMFGVPSTPIEAAVVSEAVPEETQAEVESEAESEALAENEEAPQPDFESPMAKEKKKLSRNSQIELHVADINDFNPYDEFADNSVGKSYHVATNEGSGAYVFTRDVDRAGALARAEAEAVVKAEQASEAEALQAEEAVAQVIADTSDEVESTEAPTALAAPAIEPGVPTAPAAPTMPAVPETFEPDNGVLCYRNLAGYDEAISVMRDMGVGLQNDPAFQAFVRMLNSQHGLNRMPAIDTLLFRAPLIEDAIRFVDATAGELGLPVLRMSMEEGMGGAPVLCLTAQGNNRPRMNHARNRFEGPGILVVDNLDTWVMPEIPEAPEGFGGLMMANISRGAREAVNLIRSAVEDPDVYVLVTASNMGEPDPFFYELLEPITIVDIGYPTEKERADIWAEITRNHPSIREVDRVSLMRYSEGLTRYDMYMAAREAIEDAYKQGLVQRMYVPVTAQNLYDKLAACQPLDSDQYRALEEAVVDGFKNDLDHLEDLLGGPQE